MKRISKLFLAAFISTILIVGCSSPDNTNQTSSPTQQTKTASSTNDAENTKTDSGSQNEMKTSDDMSKKDDMSHTDDMSKKDDMAKKDNAAMSKKDDMTKKDDMAMSKKDDMTKKESKAEAPKSKYKDGTFTGSAKGYNGDITVSVTISGDKITAVNVVSGSDDEPYFSTAKALTSTIVSNQSADVATVAGATFSSNGIIGAAKNAISQAKN